MSLALARGVSTRAKAAAAVDALMIPLVAPYALSALLPAPTPLARTTLLKLHALAALVPPTTDAHWAALDDLAPLVAIIEGVRAFPAPAQTTKREQILDARVRTDPQPAAATPTPSEELVQSLPAAAHVCEGPYFVVRTPEGLRGRKTRPAGDE